MVGIEDFPDQDGLDDFLRNGFLEVSDVVAGNLGDLMFPQYVLLADSWGEGTAEKGDPVEFIVAVSIEELSLQQMQENAEDILSAMDDIADQMETAISSMPLDDSDTEELIDEWFGRVSITVAKTDTDVEDIPREVSSVLNFRFVFEDIERAYDLTNQQVIVIEEKDQEEVIADLPVQERQAIEQGLEEPPEAQPEITRISVEEWEERQEEEEEPEEQDVVEPERRRFQEKEEFFDDMPPVITPFARTSETLAVPAGSEFKKVQARDIYDFEVAMGHESPDMPSDNPELQDLQEGVGFQVAIGTIGDRLPVTTFPRTGLYIKNRLYYEGPAYILEIYNDLVHYTAYISSLHDMIFKAGTYVSFRNFVGRLNRYGEQEGNERLIVKIPESDAASRGFDLIADHPTIEDEKAPWLENRQYYEVNEDNLDSEVWLNVTEEMY